MPMSKAERLVALGVPTQLAKELATQIESSAGAQIGTTAGTAMDAARVPTTAIRGGVYLQAAIPDATAAPTQAQFNALLSALRSAGIIAR